MSTPIMGELSWVNSVSNIIENPIIASSGAAV